MCSRTRFWMTLSTALLAAALPARAEILSLEGLAESSVREFLHGLPGDSDQAVDFFPTTSSTLPLQVVVRLVAGGGEQGAATAAAQFADPRDLNQPNPEEFAINLALNSLTPNTRYDGHARVEEKRDVVFSELELGAPLGQSVEVVGRLFVDGALTIFSIEPDRDLTNARVTLEVQILKAVNGLEETVFRGAIDLLGAPGGAVTVGADGAFPTTSLILTDLSAFSDELGAFHVLIIPDLVIDYTYDVVVGEEFTLRATVTVDANNLEGQTGVAAVIGTPTTALTEVIAATMGQTAAAKMLAAIEKERETPTGAAAIPPPPAPVFPFCALFGFESLALFSAFALASSIRLARRATK